MALVLHIGFLKVATIKVQALFEPVSFCRLRVVSYMRVFAFFEDVVLGMHLQGVYCMEM